MARGEGRELLPATRSGGDERLGRRRRSRCDSWQTDLESHVDFDGWQYLSRNSDHDPTGIAYSKPVVYFGSFQARNGLVPGGSLCPCSGATRLRIGGTRTYRGRQTTCSLRSSNYMSLDTQERASSDDPIRRRVLRRHSRSSGSSRRRAVETRLDYGCGAVTRASRTKE
jgi:hypothetical protein